LVLRKHAIHGNAVALKSELEHQAAHMLALATRARQQGEVMSAAILEERARELLEQAQQRKASEGERQQ
jgi:2-keto-3-deoxy-galactonokinase